MIEIKPVFIEKIKNVRNFSVMMDGLALGRGEGRLAAVYGRAGRGKTRTSQQYHAHHPGCVFLRMQTIWRTSELEFLRALCRELGISSAPGRKAPAFMMAVDALIANPKPVFLDEVEKLPRYFLDVVLDLTELSTAPFVLIGEEELIGYMRPNNRVKSRTYRALKFLSLSKPDIVTYIREASGLSIDNEVAGVFYTASDGDFRIVRRDLLSLIQIANAKQTDQITADMAQVAVKTGLAGR